MVRERVQRFSIARIQVKGMDYMDDEVQIAESEEDMRKMTNIQSEFATWSRMKFGIHKCAQ